MKNLLLYSAIILIGLTSQAQYKYLGSYDSNGVPDYLVARDTLPQSLIDNVAASLPELFPVPIYNPHLISSGYDNDIRLKDSADVWVTFVDEGAGYKNVLGFYTYDLNDTSVAKPQKNEITIIFPNVSRVDSGGDLVPEDKVHLGTFPANTGIGWVLLADGWSGGRVTEGSWDLYSNPDFNPEFNPEDRFHNVLLNDIEDDLIILGFEDIRRDYASCDNDFNDALFYITSNPVEAIVRDNFATLTTSTSVSSGNDGGLESNGNLATAIAKRNHKRATDHSATNKKVVQQNMRALTGARTDNTLQRLIPESGMNKDEEVRVSTPSDLKDLTNAEEVFAADYYLNESRTAVVLITETKNLVYNHSKNICDRLNNGSVKDVRYVKFKGMNLLYAEISRDQDTKEYVSWFSVLESEKYYETYSHWNLDEYPSGDFINVQIWGASPAQVFHKVDLIIKKLEVEKSLLAGNAADLPLVYVKNGHYYNGKLTLTLSNKSEAKQVDLKAKIRKTELSELDDFTTNLVLDGSTEQTVTIEIGSIFDAGISLHSEGSSTVDNLYLADGSWGMDYAQESKIFNFSITAQTQSNKVEEAFLVERNFEIKGESSDVVNVFRNLMAGNKVLDISGYQSLSFEFSSNRPLEVVLVPADLEDWSARPKQMIASTRGEFQSISLRLADFFGGEEHQEIQSIVFSYINQSGSRESFNYSVKNLAFTNSSVLNSEVDESITDGMSIYPNPVVDFTTITVNTEVAQEYQITLRHLDGRVLHSSKGKVYSGINRLSYVRAAQSAGVYILTIKLEDNQSYSKKILFQ